MLRVLVAVDLSPASRNAWEAAVSLAEGTAAQLVLLNVRAQKDAKAKAKPAGKAKATADAAARELARMADGARRRGIAVEVIQQEARSATSAIVATAGTTKASILVVGNKGHSAMRDWLLGSVARDVLARSAVPVLTVPPRHVAKDAVRSPGAARTLLVATDFSADAGRALAAALAIGPQLGCAVHLLHVVDLPFTTAHAPYSEALVSPEMVRRDEAKARRRLAALARKAKGASVTTAVAVGHPAATILHEAARIDAALVVVAPRGQGAVQRLVLGSVAKAVVQLADRPVLVVPDPKGISRGR